MQFKAVIFDFDGTLANSSHAIMDVIMELSEEYNLPKIDKNDLNKFKNMSFRQILKESGMSKLRLFFFLRKARKLLGEKIPEIRVYPGMLQVLKDLKDKGVILGIVTSNSKNNVEKFLENNSIDLINFVHSEPGLFGKDKVLNKCIKNLKLDKNEVIYVGDETRDIEAARESGIKIISVTWGYNGKEILNDYKPDHLVDTPKQLLKILTKI